MSNETARQLQKHLERLEARQEQTRKQIEHFRGVIAFFMAMEDSDELNLTPGDLLKNHIEYILQVRGVPLHPKDIHQILQDQAIHVPGEDPVHNTRSHMSGDKQERFYPAGNGTWGLTRWKTQANRPDQPCLALNPGDPTDPLPESEEPAANAADPAPPANQPETVNTAG